MKPGIYSISSFKVLYILMALFNLLACHNKADSPFETLPGSETGITFTNTLEKKKLFSILYYLYYYNGGGVATGDINNDGLTDIYFTGNHKAGNKLYLNKGNFQFTDITLTAGVAGESDWCTGVTMADVNGDGYMDIYVSAVSKKYGLNGHNQLFINNGNQTFKDKSSEYGLNFSGFTTQAAFFDYDHDGDLDCYVMNQSHHPHANIVNAANRKNYDSLSGDILYRNDLNVSGHFTDVSKTAGIYQGNLGYGLGLAIADFNNDGWDDIYIGNDFHENDYYYLNKGDGSFIEDGASHFRHYSRFSMGNDAADYNNDGQMDIVTVDMLPPDEKTLKTYGSDENADIYKVKLAMNGYQLQYSKNCLQRNNGNGSSFSETALMSGIAASDWSWAPLLADFDNDGNKDLFISSGIVKRPVDLDYIRFVSDLQLKKGMNKTDKYDDIAIEKMPDGNSHPFLYQGDGISTFKDVSADWGTANLNGYFNGAAYADLDNDGDLDLVINCLNAPAVLLKNNLPKKNYISVNFKADNLNTSGIGAKAYLFAKGKMQYQQLSLTRGFQSSCEPRLHFGLDSLTMADSLLIVWPDQQYQLIRNIPVNKNYTIKKNEAAGHFDYAAFFPPAKEILEDITTSLQNSWRHQENDFLDYNIQYLIPHQLSTRGPKLAVGDINKDGLDDFFVCGAKSQPGCVMIQGADGKFIATDTSLFNKFSASEDVDAVFFDADMDGWLDLYTVSGGNEYIEGNPNLEDHLYINDRKGHFKVSENALPKLLVNKSVVSIADIDKDGDSDLFIGVLADAKKYGIPQTSYLLINDGKGNFKIDPTINLTEIGMVTTAGFADLNNDGWTDLVVTGEWMPVKIYMNNKGKLVAHDVAQSTGLWQSIFLTDVNGDGFTDILAGNWGHNSKLSAGKNGPLKLYVKDFDRNGSIDQVMAYTVNGNEYPFLAKDELERALPVLKKAYLNYSEVAGQTVQYMFHDLFKDYIELKAEVLGSSCFINNGRGDFKRVELPNALQLAPVFTFVPVAFESHETFLAAGNFYGIIPYEGRYDALVPTFISFNKGVSEFTVDQTLNVLDGEVRDAKWLNCKGGQKILIVARNNNALLFYKKTK